MYKYTNPNPLYGLKHIFSVPLSMYDCVLSIKRHSLVTLVAKENIEMKKKDKEIKKKNAKIKEKNTEIKEKDSKINSNNK